MFKSKSRINLALAFNFAFTDSPLIEEEEEQIKYLLDEFLFKVISNSNEKCYNFLLDMLSCYAHRKQTNAILILVGEGGTGKSKFIELLQALFGSSCKMMTDQVMSGQDMFNSSMIGTSIGYIEETNGKGESNYTDIQRTLKRLSTSKYITCRKMQTDSFDVLNIINFVVITNFIKDIKHDRRNFPLEPSTHRINDKAFYKKITSILENKRLMQGLFNMIYKRSFEVWARDLPTTEVLEDFTERNSMKIIHEFFIDKYLFSEGKERMCMADLFPQYQKYLIENGKAEMKISETIFRHEIRQFLTKDTYHAKNITYYTTTKESIRLNLKARKISDEMIESRKPQEVDIDEVFSADDYDPVARLQKENLNLTNIIEEQKRMIEELKAMVEKTQKTETKTETKTAPKKKKKSYEVETAWEKMKNII